MLDSAPTKDIEDTVAETEEWLMISFSETKENLCFCLHYRVIKNQLYVDKTQIWKCKSLSNVPDYNFCVGNMYSAIYQNNQKEFLNRVVCTFAVNINIIKTEGIINVYNHLMKKYDTSRTLQNIFMKHLIVRHELL